MTENGKSTVEKLNEARAKLSDRDNRIASFEGKKEQTLEDIKTKFNFGTTKEAETYLEDVSKTLEEKESEIKTKLEKLDKDLEKSGMEV